MPGQVTYVGFNIWPQRQYLVICTGVVHSEDVQSKLVDLKAQLIQSHGRIQYTSYNLGNRRKDQWFLNATFVPGLVLDAIHRHYPTN